MSCGAHAGHQSVGNQVSCGAACFWGNESSVIRGYWKRRGFGSSHLWHQASLGFYLAIFSLSAVASFSSVKQGKEGEKPSQLWFVIQLTDSVWWKLQLGWFLRKKMWFKIALSQFGDSTFIAELSENIVNITVLQDCNFSSSAWSEPTSDQQGSCARISILKARWMN